MRLVRTRSGPCLGCSRSAGERLRRGGEPVRFRVARRESSQSSGAQVVGFGCTRSAVGARTVSLCRACRISDAPGRRDAQGWGRRCLKAWVMPRQRSWSPDVHRTGSGKLAPRKPASNSPDTDLFGFARAAVLMESGLSLTLGSGPWPAGERVCIQPGRGSAYGRRGFRAVTGNSVRGVDTRAGCS